MTQLYNKPGSKHLRSRLRRTMPPAEAMLWNRLRGCQLDGLKFRRQHGVGHYVVDFYCPAKHLAIELDGDSHSEAVAAQQDEARQKYIEGCGIRVIRFSNRDIYENLEGVVEFIVRNIESEEIMSKQPFIGFIKREG